jgi:phage gp46-like protein
MDFAIDLTNGYPGMTYEKANTILNNVYLSLSVVKGSFFAAPEFGMSRRGRMKNTAENAKLIRDDAIFALQWLLDSKRATSVQVNTERDMSQDLYRLKLLVTVTQADGRRVSFEKFVEVV